MVISDTPATEKGLWARQFPTMSRSGDQRSTRRARHRVCDADRRGQESHLPTPGYHGHKRLDRCDQSASGAYMGSMQSTTGAWSGMYREYTRHCKADLGC
jgi:hypothetical protein